jgi:hypothetical protein
VFMNKPMIMTSSNLSSTYSARPKVFLEMVILANQNLSIEDGPRVVSQTSRRPTQPEREIDSSND